MFSKRAVFSTTLAVTLIGADQLLKFIAIKYLKYHTPYIFMSDFFRLEYAENKGAFLSLGSGMSDNMRFLVLNVLVTLVVLWLLQELVRKRLEPFRRWAYILIVAGGVGNLIDRYFRSYVVDFANMGIGSLRTGIFNLADVYIMVALLLLILPEHLGSRSSVLSEQK